VVLAYGAVSDRDLGLEGEYTTKNVFPSRKVVDWYNGSLDNRMQPGEFDLSQIGELAIVGNGNVACDIARMMLKKPEEFKDSDTPSPVMNALANTSLHCVQMIGRRGTVQTAFTTKEIRELTSLDNLGVYMVKPEVLDSKTDASDLESLGRGIERRTDFLHKRAALIESAEQYEDLVNDKSHRKLILRYLRSPTEIMVDD
jgi:adrenodoxin-NADP+ reductase